MQGSSVLQPKFATEGEIAPTDTADRISVYVHFPWCLRKCPYCDFASLRIDPPAIPHATYADAVVRELELRAPALAGKHLHSVFFGGGTPSLWDTKELGRVLESIGRTFGGLDTTVEVTAECNPSSMDEEKTRALADTGVNRLSIGVQSLDLPSLRYLGRSHDAARALRVLEDAVRVISRVSGDLIFGLPNQSPDDFAEEIGRVVQTGVEHVSAYALTIEPGTQFGELARKGRLPIVTDDAYADTFLKAREVLASLGFSHYEVSNYARPGAEARHNQHYWRGGEYLGLGAGAVGCVWASSDTRRYRNDPDPARYMEARTTKDFEVFEEKLSRQDRVREALMLGLRTLSGVDVRELGQKLDIDVRAGRERVLARRLESGDLVLDDGTLRVPPDRWLVLDGIVADLF